MVSDRRRRAAGPGLRSRELSTQSSQALHRARMGRGQQGRRAIRKWQHAQGRPLSGSPHRCPMDGCAERIRRRDRRRRRAEKDFCMQRILGLGGKPQRCPRLVAAPVLESGDELQLTGSFTSTDSGSLQKWGSLSFAVAVDKGGTQSAVLRPDHLATAMGAPHG